jgi:hypothetical protein
LLFCLILANQETVNRIFALLSDPAMAAPITPSKFANPSKPKRNRILFYVGVFVGVSMVIGLIILVFGRVTGVEFSPDRFETRRFSVHEIPILKIQISPIRRTASQSATARYLVAKSLIQPSKANASQPAANAWHLVELSRGGMSHFEADAKLLTDQLDTYAQNHNKPGEFWHNWSTNEPKKAQVLWPTIQKLAQRELYILVPRLFSMATDAKDEKALKLQIDEYLRENYAGLVAEMRDAKRPEVADDLLAEALADYPDDKQLQALKQAL